MLQVGKMTVLNRWNKYQDSVGWSRNRFALMDNGIFEWAEWNKALDTKVAISGRGYGGWAVAPFWNLSFLEAIFIKLHAE